MPHKSNTYSGKTALWKWLLFGLVVGIGGVLWRLQDISDWARKAAQPADEPEPLTPLIPSRSISAVVHERKVTDKPQPAALQPDDLKQVKGIGPKSMQLLNEHGIYTFEQLASVEIGYLQSMLEKRNWRVVNPSTWPAQAKTLASKETPGY